MNRISHRLGFTLVELLVVIGIIAVLISILLPSLARARESAKTLAGLSNLRQMGQAIHMYVDDHHGYLPYGQKDHEPTDPDTTHWLHLINPYLGASSGTSRNTIGTGLSRVFQDPNATLEGGACHYSSNPIIMPDLSTGLLPYKLTHVQRASEIILIMDGAQVLPNDSASMPVALALDGWFVYGGYLYFDSDPGSVNQPINPGSNGDAMDWSQFPPACDIRWRQARGTAANVLFADGHAETRRKGEILRSNIKPNR